MSRQAVRRLCALVAGVVGALDLVLAANQRPPFRAGPLGIDWAVDAVIGARYLLLLAGLSLILVTRGLLHGKRNAWLIAFVAALVSVPSHHVKSGDVVGMVASAVLVAILAAGRRSFGARSDPLLARRGLQLLLFGEAVVFVYGVAGLYTLDEEFRDSTTLGQSMREAGRLLFLLPTATIEPITRHGRWFIESVRFAALLVVMLALVRMVASVIGHPRHAGAEAHRVRRLLDEYATGGLAYFELLDDKTWFIASDGEAFIGYKVVGSTALALGEPIGRRESQRLAASEYVAFCQQNGWSPAFHQVTEEGRELLAEVGLRALKIGEEAIVEVQRWSIDGPHYKSLRSAIRRVERAGCRFAELPAPLSDATIAELRDVSDAWLAAGGHRERTFTLGRFDPEYLRETTVVAVLDADDRIVAFANILPAYRSRNGNFDLMRRRPDAPNGVMEYLFVQLIERFRAEGRDGMTLGLAPLANLTGDTVPDRALRFLYEHGETAFNFEGLRRFKDKWEPRWEPRYLVYRRDTELAKVAAATSRAGELERDDTVVGRAGTVARRFAFTFATGSLQIWLMVVTAASVVVYHQLKRHLAVSWPDLLHLQWWRLGTELFIQTRAGFIWTNVLLMAITFPLAEWRLGTRRTVATFFLCDWFSTIVTYLGLLTASALGVAGAHRLLVERDGGPSAGAWALATAVALSFQSRRARRAGMAFVVGFLLCTLVAFRQLFDVQHLLAVLGAVLLTRGPVWWRAMRERSGPELVEPAVPEPAGRG